MRFGNRTYRVGCLARFTRPTDCIQLFPTTNYKRTNLLIFRFMHPFRSKIVSYIVQEVWHVILSH